MNLSSSDAGSVPFTDTSFMFVHMTSGPFLNFLFWMWFHSFTSTLIDLHSVTSYGRRV